MDWNQELHQLGMSLVWTALGVVLFGISILLMDKLAPFSIRKEIEEDQNTALGIVIGAALIGIAMIVAAVIR